MQKKGSPISVSPAPAEINQLGTLFNTGRYAELESRVRPLVNKYPASGVTWKLFGLALLMQGKEALPALKKTVQLLPNDAEALSNLAGGLRVAGQLMINILLTKKAAKHELARRFCS